MNKRGLSAVITTLIMIVLVLIAVGIVWVISNGVINNNIDTPSTGISKIDLKVVEKSVKVDYSLNTFDITVKRNLGEGDLSKIKFVLSDGTNSATVDSGDASDLKELGQKPFTGNALPTGISHIESIELVPVFKTSSGSEKIAETTDKYNLDLKDKIPEYNNLVSWWKLDGNAIDEKGKRNGIITGVTFVDGKAGKAGKFDSATYTYIDFSPNTNWAFPGDFSISLWINPTVMTSDRFIISNIDATGNYWSFGINGGNAQKLGFGDKGFSNYCKAVYGQAWGPIDNKWHHLVVVRNVLSLKIYKDGNPLTVSGTITTSGSFDTVGNLRIGECGVGGCRYGGLIDEVMIYNKALTDNEVKALYDIKFD